MSKKKPSLLVIGKLGIHADPELDIGGNAEALLRNVDCAVLLSQREYQPRVDVVADVTTSWTTEAEKRMENVPEHALNMVRMAILRYAQERGHTVVTASIVDEATAELCPAQAREAMAEIVAAYDAGDIGTAREELEEIAWSISALALLQSVAEPSVRESIKRRAEKKAIRANNHRVEDEHVSAFLSGKESTTGKCPFAHHNQADTVSDEQALTWDAAAHERLQRVPEGFIRTLTRRRVEAFVRRKGESTVTSKLLDDKYSEWAKGSAKQSVHLTWDDETWHRVQQIPDFVRGMVIKEIEECARQLGVDTVTTEVLAHARDAWSDMGIFHSETAPDQYRDEGRGG